MNAIVNNSMKCIHEIVTFYRWMILLSEGKIVSVPEFLQRPKLVEDWTKKNYEVAKEYIVSVWKGTHGLDGFSIVPIDLLIEKLKDKLKATNQKAYNKALKLLETLKADGAEYVSLDGQSRSWLSILPYVKGDYTLGKHSNKILLEVDGKLDTQTLSNTRYQDLPLPIKKILDNRELVVTTVTEFDDFDDVLDALGNKQKGFKWTDFQQLKIKNRFHMFIVKLLELFEIKQGKTFSKLWENKILRPKTAFKYDRDGHQLFSITLAALLEKGQWLRKVDDIVKGAIEPTKATYNKIFEYCNEILEIRSDKTKVSEIINWIVFRWTIDGGNKSNPLYKNLGFTKMYSIKKKKELINEFLVQHEILKKKGNKFSWTKVGKDWIRLDQGYFHSQENQSTESITSRMKIFLSQFDFDKCVEEGILNPSRKMPTINEIIVKNNFKSLDGKKIDMTDLGSYDRSHHESKYNGGSNMLDNLSVEKSGPNRSRRSQNINK